MDNKDQRNGSVPLGTFNEEASGETGEQADVAGEGILTELERADARPGSSAEFARSNARPTRKRVRTLLGVPLADVGDQAPPSARGMGPDSISETIQYMLDEQHSIAIEIDDSEV